MFDDNLKPWLLEVNASPSLSANTKSDERFKVQMLNEMLDLVDIEGKMTGDETTHGGFDLIYKSEAILKDKNCVYSTNLGYAIPKKPVVKKKKKKAEGEENSGVNGGTPSSITSLPSASEKIKLTASVGSSPSVKNGGSSLLKDKT